MNFLASLFRQGLQHRTVNTIRSAVSVTHDREEGVPLGQHPLVTRIMKGIHNARPPRPRYAETWDVGKVVSHLKGLGQNEDLSMKQLVRKLAVLMALVQACRSSELAALDLDYRIVQPEGVTFKLATLTKKRSPGAPPKQLFFGGFPEDERICIVRCLKAYEEITAGYREEGQGKLFLSYVKPFRPVTSQRIAKWIKEVLGEAGVDTSIFSAHSTRGAATTAALNQGVSMAEVLKMADWSSDAVFKKHYYRPTKDPTFAHKILSD